MITIGRAYYDRDDGYAVLYLEVNGRMVQLDAYPKPTLFWMGLVSLGSEFVDLPEFTHQIYLADGGVNILHGFTDDLRIWECYKRFLQATADGTFTPGPQDIP